tara:strand:- start:933 stop:1592 length:660 start_codon:yes stop_codon:yes gene_type:complete
MKKIQILAIAISVCTLLGCEGKFEITNSLEPATLLEPLNNERCFGTQLDEGKIRVAFDWEDLDQITEYTINYEDAVTGLSNSLTTQESFISIDLEPGTLYTWNVVVSDAFGNSAKSEEDFNFYTEGLSEANHVPFPASISFEENGNSNITINWEGSDLDNDIDYYQVFFSRENPPSQIIDNTSENSLSVDVVSGSTYYLNIITFDENGNFSESRSFKQF